MEGIITLFAANGPKLRNFAPGRTICGWGSFPPTVVGGVSVRPPVAVAADLSLIVI